MKHSLMETDIARKIHLLRGEKVMLDRDLAVLYDVKSIRLREQVKRNIARFPEDFMFQLTEMEVGFMVSRNAIPSKQHLGGSLPYVFTQEGIAMLSSVLKSKRAIEVNIQIMRAFVRLRKILAENKEFSDKLDKLEKRMDKNDENVEYIFTAIRQLMAPPETPPKKKIGFTNKLKGDK